MSVSVTTVPATNIQLYAACQGLLGQTTNCQLNAIYQGNGHYWNANEAHTSGQAQSLGTISNTSYVDIQGQRQGVLTNPQVVQAPISMTWIRGNCYGGAGQNAILITAAASGSAYVLNQGYVVYGGGGAGGAGSDFVQGATAGGDGAQGIVIQGATTKVLYNQAGTIYGGGGGGGGGGCSRSTVAFGGGGGGGVSFGVGGISGFPSQTVHGGTATATSAGVGGPHGDAQQDHGGSGGNGGGPGGAGQAGGNGTYGTQHRQGGAGGAGGQGTATFTTVNQQGGASN